MFSLLAYRGKIKSLKAFFFNIRQIVEWNICPLSPPPIHTWQVTEVMLELKSFWLWIPSSCKVGWVFLWAYCVCKQKAAVLLGHRAMLEAPSALSIKTENSGKQTWLSRGLGWCLLFLTKLSRSFQLRNLKTSASMTVLPAMRHILGSLPADVLYGQRWSSQVGEGGVTPGKLGMTRSCISKAYTGQWRLKSCLLDLSACFA